MHACLFVLRDKSGVWSTSERRVALSDLNFEHYDKKISLQLEIGWR